MSEDLLEVAAPSRSAAETLAGRLERCHCLVVQRGRQEWVVKATPWRDDGRSLTTALSAVEAWLVDTGTPVTTVAVGDRTFTLSAGSRT
jgi:hypothetical protein